MYHFLLLGVTWKKASLGAPSFRWEAPTPSSEAALPAPPPPRTSKPPTPTPGPARSAGPKAPKGQPSCRAAASRPSPLCAGAFTAPDGSLAQEGPQRTALPRGSPSSDKRLTDAATAAAGGCLDGQRWVSPPAGLQSPSPPPPPRPRHPALSRAAPFRRRHPEAPSTFWRHVRGPPSSPPSSSLRLPQRRRITVRSRLPPLNRG